MTGEGESEDELAQVLDAYLAEVEAGRPVDPEEWVGRHPAIADRLRACLKSLHLVEAAAEAMAIAPGPAYADPDAEADTDAERKPIRPRGTPTVPGSATSASSASSAAAAWASSTRPSSIRWAGVWP